MRWPATVPFIAPWSRSTRRWSKAAAPVNSGTSPSCCASRVSFCASWPWTMPPSNRSPRASPWPKQRLPVPGSFASPPRRPGYGRARIVAKAPASYSHQSASAFDEGLGTPDLQDARTYWRAHLTDHRRPCRHHRPASMRTQSSHGGAGACGHGSRATFARASGSTRRRRWRTRWCRRPATCAPAAAGSACICWTARIRYIDGNAGTR